jgi:hypothetical protein
MCWAFAGQLWWVDVTWGAITADPLSDRPELRFVHLPGGSVMETETERVEDLPVIGRYRGMGVSEGRMRYVEVSQKEPFMLSSFALDDDGCCWTLEHRVALSRILTGRDKCYPWQHEEDTPRIGVIYPLNVKDRRWRPEGVNGSQFKFLNEIWPMSRNQPEATLF